MRRQTLEVVVNWSWAVGYGHTCKVLGITLTWPHGKGRVCQGTCDSWPVFLQVLLGASLQVTKLVLILIVSGGGSHVPRINLEHQLLFEMRLVLVRRSGETYSLPEADLVYFFGIFSI